MIELEASMETHGNVECKGGGPCAVGSQCDQMARLFVQYLDFYKNGDLPNSIKRL